MKGAFPIVAVGARGGARARAAAAECGPDKLGVSRVQTVGTEGGLDVGWKTYRDTLPLADHEVILTFDDGPDPATTPAVLEALKAQCVRATFFAIGRNADAYPKLMRREVEEGHNVAYHTYTHPQPTLRYMAPAVARADILKGVIAVERAAYGQDFAGGEPDDLSKIKMHAPFFRFPGFADTADLRDVVRQEQCRDLRRRSLGVRLDQDDAGSGAEAGVLGRLDKARKGMLLLHDNRPWTAQMLPRFLEELKARGYRDRADRGGARPRADRSGAGGLALGDRAHDRLGEAAAGRRPDADRGELRGQAGAAGIACSKLHGDAGGDHRRRLAGDARHADRAGEPRQRGFAQARRAHLADESGRAWSPSRSARHSRISRPPAPALTMARSSGCECVITTTSAPASAASISPAGSALRVGVALPGTKRGKASGRESIQRTRNGRGASASASARPT